MQSKVPFTKVYFTKGHDEGGIFWQCKGMKGKLRLAGNPKILLKTIYASELEKMGGNVNNNIVIQSEARESASKIYMDILGYLDKASETLSPFVLYLYDDNHGKKS